MEGLSKDTHQMLVVVTQKPREVLVSSRGKFEWDLYFLGDSLLIFMGPQITLGWIS